MAVIRAGDEDLHYSDSSHRTIAPTEEDQPAWEERLKAHLAEHAGTQGRRIPAPRRSPERRTGR